MNLPFSDPKTFCSHLIWPKNVNAPDFIICCRKKEYGWKFFLKGGGIPNRTTQNTWEYGAVQRVQGGYLMKQHFGPCTLPHFPNRDEKLRPLVASSWRQCSPHPFFWQDFLALEPVSQIRILWSRLKGLIMNKAPFTRPYPSRSHFFPSPSVAQHT